ncbi:MAG: hypothetical protein WAW37_05565 [Syntrophobacteraceae bacterium]
MKKLAVFLCVVLVLALTCFSARAATVTGEVLDQATGLAVETNGSIYANKWNSESSNWEFVTSTTFGPTDTNFTFSNLQAGTYYFAAYAPGYVSEYYNNKTVFDSKNQVTLTASQTKNLATILLKPLPIRLSNFQVMGNQVPAEGGNVRVRCDVVNDYASSRVVVVWPTIRADRTLYGSTYTSDKFDGAPAKTVTVGANSVVTVTFWVTVPASAPPGSSYIYMHCGQSKWAPYMGDVYVANIAKAAP